MIDNVLVVVRRIGWSIYLEFTGTTTVAEIKLRLEGITGASPYDQKLILMNDDIEMDDDCALRDYGIPAGIPLHIGLCLRLDDGDFEPLDIMP